MTQEQPRRGEWQPTHAQLFADAVWDASADELTTTEALVLLAYAGHARRKDRAWVAYLRLMQQCKIRSASTTTRVLKSLVEKGWLEPVGPARSHKQSALYRLIIPGETTAMSEVDRADKRSGTSLDHGTASTIGAVGAPDSQTARNRKPRGETTSMVDETTSMVDETASTIGADHADGQQPLSGGPSGNLREGTPTARAGALAGAPSREEQTRAGNGTRESAALRRKTTPAELAAMLRAPIDGQGDDEKPAEDCDCGAADCPYTNAKADPSSSNQAGDQPMSAEEAKARMRAMLAGKPSAKFSRWPQPRDTTPNPHFDPAALDQLAAVGDPDPA